LFEGRAVVTGPCDVVEETPVDERGAFVVETPGIPVVGIPVVGTPVVGTPVVGTPVVVVPGKYLTQPSKYLGVEGAPQIELDAPPLLKVSFPSLGR
jgi:hypothetical protein